MFAIPVADLNSQAIEATLDNTLYYIILNWNQSGGYWTIGIRNAAYQTLISGISVSANYPLTWQFRYADMPPGELTVASAKDRSGPVPRDGFATKNYELIYFEEADLLALNVLNAFGRTQDIAV